MRRLFTFVCMLALATAARAADDPVKTKLDNAKAAFVSDIENYRKAVGSYFDAREAAARNAGDKQAVDTIKSQREAFLANGELPNDAPRNLKQKRTAARAVMEAAYQAAIKEYVRARKDDAANAVQKEMDAFLAAGNTSAPDDVRTKVEDAAKMVGKTCTVQFQVKRSLQQPGWLALFAEAQDGPPQQLTVWIKEDASARRQLDPSTYQGHEIRATGEVKIVDAMVELRPPDRSAISILDPAETPKEGAKPATGKPRRAEFKVKAKAGWQEIGSIVQGRYKFTASGQWSFDSKHFHSADGEGQGFDRGAFAIRVDDVVRYYIGSDKSVDLPAGKLFAEMKDGGFDEAKWHGDNAGEIDVVMEEVK